MISIFYFFSNDASPLLDPQISAVPGSLHPNIYPNTLVPSAVMTNSSPFQESIFQISA